jgi:hypothetical protein
MNFAGVKNSWNYAAGITAGSGDLLVGSDVKMFMQKT